MIEELEEIFFEIAEAIREKNNTSINYLPKNMPAAIKEIETGSEEKIVGFKSSISEPVYFTSSFSIITDSFIIPEFLNSSINFVTTIQEKNE